MTKPQIALNLIRQVMEQGVAPSIVLADAGYGNETVFGDQVTALGLVYAVGIGPGTSVWAPGTAPLPAKKWTGNGRPPTCLRHDAKHKPVSVKKLAQSLAQDAWQIIRWREGVDQELSSRFARLRVRPAHRDHKLNHPTSGRVAADRMAQGRRRAKYWFSTLPVEIAFDKMVDIVKLRWRIERDYQG